MIRKRATQAYTLIEMATVFVIVGLLIGAVLAGQSLIHSSRLNTALKDANTYVFAVNNFKQQYQALPGDMLNARVTALWSSSAGGDGDGQISGDERFRAWEHLNLAGYSTTKATGATGGGGADDFVIGSNVPESRFKGAGFALYFTGTPASPVAASASTYALTLGNTLTIGASAGSNNGAPIRAIFTPTEAFNLDTKADDGIPGTGKWIANLTGPSGAAAAYNFSGGTACTTGANTDPGTYDLSPSHDVQNCSFFIKTGY